MKYAIFGILGVIASWGILQFIILNISAEIGAGIILFFLFLGLCALMTKG